MARAKFNFTKRSIEALPNPKTERVIFRDTGVRGLGLLVQPTGYRSFFWFRKVRSTPAWKTIGPFPDLSVEQARAKADEFNTMLARWKAADWEGRNPFEQHDSPTLRAALADYAEHRLRKTAKDPDKAIRSMNWMAERYFASWLNRTLSAFRSEEVDKLHTKIGDEYGHYMANRVFELLRAVFNHAIKRKLFHGDNPARAVDRFHETKRTRFAQPDELPRLFKALQDETNEDLKAFVVLALTTGARRSNILSMRWEDISLTADGKQLWTIPNPKNREPYTIPLVNEAVKILSTRKRRQHSDSPWVFPSTSKSGHVADLKRSWQKLRGCANLSDLRIHDLRRTLGSWQAGAGVSLPIIGKTLGHRSGAATQVYARLHLDPVRTAIETATTAMLAAGKTNKLLGVRHGN
jgi:integrase